MRVHHLNCISACPLGGWLMDRGSHDVRGKFACHCVLVETDRGLVLLDTGYGLSDVHIPRSGSRGSSCACSIRTFARS